ncbi:hypothetical protein Nepgr_003746 [Nepenthes gracilis]|uniref:AAA+ ATPase domain-containing protein n=1 Tax=Nepenthes gracilis TaxID=150966 RepID=A0AAD3S059_NEPGR|nr:hypothetical protein Nepgr_003746 [Nepenthes gracilis]
MATAVLGILISPVVEVAKCLFVPLQIRIGYILNYQGNVDDLKTQTAELMRMRDSIKRDVDEARRRGEAINDDCIHWLTKVDGVELDLQMLDSHLGEGKNKCSDPCHPNLSTRYMLGKTAAKMVKLVLELQRDAKSISVSRPGPVPSIEMMPTSDFKAFESTKSAMMEILAALNRDENRIIGVYGMGGVGKTSLMKELAKQAKGRRIFDEVVIATVSQNPNQHKIQSEIAEGLGLRLIEESASIRALRLAARLKQERRVLLILDDVWERLELALVGIPSVEDHNGCKIAITTRSLDVCSEMDCDTNIMVQVLSEQDSWDLFKKVSGNVVDSPDLQDVAKQVAKECGGLPIALVTLGRVLKNKELSIWLDAAKALRLSIPVNIKGMHEKVFSCLQLSFDQAQSEEEKLCFLYCSMYPEDYDVQIEDLVRYSIGEGLFPDMETVDEARSRMRSIISNLKASCLILQSSKEGCIKMHDVFRDLAISIATSNDYSFMVKASTGLEEWPKKKYVMRMSLIDNEFRSLPSEADYPELVLLLLQNNRKLRVIPDDFFAGMTALQVLDLSHIPYVEAIPKSISCLTNLKALNIENNHIRDISALGELKSLEILSLRRSSFALFPEQLGQLTNLRLLDLTGSQIGIIPSKVISRLSRLEELYMWQSYSMWEVQESQSEGRATLAEVLYLERINSLYIHISKCNCLTEDITSRWRNLKKFHIHIGDGLSWQHTTRTRIMSFNIPDQDTVVHKPVADWAKRLVEATEELFLSQWKELWSLEQLQAGSLMSVKSLHIQRCGLRNGFSSTMLDRIGHLRELSFLNCSNLGEIFVSTGSDPAKDVLPRLTTMYLQDLPSLKTIWKGVAPSVCFESLIDVKVKYCMQLKSLFSSALAEALKHLESLEVSNCVSMKTLISKPFDEIQAGLMSWNTNSINTEAASLGFEGTKTLFPRLRSLHLIHLKNLTSLTETGILLDCPSLEQLAVIACPGLKKLPFEPQSLLRVNQIRADRKWFEDLEWDNGRTKLHLQKCLIDTSEA